MFQNITGTASIVYSRRFLKILDGRNVLRNGKCRLGVQALPACNRKSARIYGWTDWCKNTAICDGRMIFNCYDNISTQGGGGGGGLENDPHKGFSSVMFGMISKRNFG